MSGTNFNWISGERRAAHDGLHFDLAAAGTREPLGRWPRSGEVDVGLALSAALDADRAWRRTPWTERRALVQRGCERLIAACDPFGLATSALGFDEHEFASHLEGFAEALALVVVGRADDLARSALGAREGPCLFAPHPSETWCEPARRIVFALLAGRTVVLIGDGLLPMIADALARAFEDLPPGVLSVIFDDGETALRAARALRGFSDLHVSVAAGDLRALDVRSIEAPLEERIVLRTRSHVILSDADLAEQAFIAVERAIGRASALSGWRPGQIGRFLVPATVFSRFTAAFLHELERHPAVQAPLALARGLQDDALERGFALGLDEGATAIFTGQQSDQPLFPIVFTNVEARMRIAGLGPPAAIVCLLRVADATRALALAQRIDENGTDRA